jgi:hypothetical protein
MSLLSGVVQNGQVILDNPLPYPDGTTVRIEVVPKEPAKPPEPAEDFEPVTAEEAASDPLLWLAYHAIESDRTDGADEHDHYIYGCPKRSETKPANDPGAA